MAEKDWSEEEVNLVIEDYFSMLRKELAGQLYSKTQHRTLLKEQLNRTDGSIEFKRQNISAVMINLGLPFIKGYKPMWNYQRILLEKTIQYLSRQKTYLEPLFVDFANTSSSPSSDYNFQNLVEKAPEQNKDETKSKIEKFRKPFKINYLEREQNNIDLGRKGEELVIEYEKWRLISASKAFLSDKIEWVSEYDDGAGFDILSKNVNGTDRYIEVKTTKLSKETPIFFSKTEYDISKSKGMDYYLYRLFNFNKEPKMFNLNGDFDSFCSKEAVLYKGFF
jgi:hypothetical protein